MGGGDSAPGSDLHDDFLPWDEERDAGIRPIPGVQEVMHQLRVSALLAILLLSGCSTFERAWKEPAPIAAGKTFEGKWEGTWKSAKHHNASGRLRCLLTERS